MENNENNGNKENVEFNWENDPSKNAGVSEGIKRLLTSGLSAVLMSEDGVRQYFNDLKLPKDALGSLLKGVSKSKEEIVALVGNELSKLVEKLDIVEELTKFVREHKIKVSAEFEFSKKEKKSGE